MIGCCGCVNCRISRSRLSPGNCFCRCRSVQFYINVNYVKIKVTRWHVSHTGRIIVKWERKTLHIHKVYKTVNGSRNSLIGIHISCHGLFPLPDSDSDLDTDSFTMQILWERDSNLNLSQWKHVLHNSHRVWNPNLSLNLNPSPAVEMSHYKDAC